MRESRKIEKWVVYQTVNGPHAGIRSVCTEGEWQELERSNPADYLLVMKDITDENEAEKLARGASGDKPPRVQKTRPQFK